MSDYTEVVNLLEQVGELQEKIRKLESEKAELISLLMNHDQHEDEEWKRDYENILNKLREK